MGEFVAYYRVSTERQRVSGPGLEAQREAGAIRQIYSPSPVPNCEGPGPPAVNISLSADKGLGEGLEGKLGVKVGPVGGEASGSLPFVKGDNLVNPITNATGSVSGTLTGETESSKLSGAGSANGEDTAIGGNYGEGLVGGLEVSAGTDSLIDVGKEMVNGLINDTKQFVQDIKTAATCTPSGCTAPK